MTKPAITHSCDIAIVGAGIAGLWIAARLRGAGYDILVIEKDSIGGWQTLASQGMIHGGQKYVLTGAVANHAASSAAMPARWEACFRGEGEIDLSSVSHLSDTQVMWPAGGIVADAAVFAAANTVNAGTTKLKPESFPPLLARMREAGTFKGSVYELPEKVMNVRSLIDTLARGLEDRILEGRVDGVEKDGTITVSGVKIKARRVIFAAGEGNEEALKMLGVESLHTQRRPLRQVMVRPLPYALYGHGIVADPKPRATVTAHPQGDGSYVWAIGANIAEKGAHMSEDETLAFAKKELSDMFPGIDWDEKEWASLPIDRAEPFDPGGWIKAGPHVMEEGAVLLAWPTKLTFTPALADMVAAKLAEKEIAPSHATTPPPPLPRAKRGLYPWEKAQWKTLPAKDRKTAAA